MSQKFNIFRFSAKVVHHFDFNVLILSYSLCIIQIVRVGATELSQLLQKYCIILKT